MLRTMTKMSSSRLISHLSVYPVLYDKKHPDYMDKEMKREIWDEIGKEMRCSVAQCKTRWSSLRDGYRRSLKRNKLREKKGLKPNPYRYCNKLKFLRKYVVLSKPSSDVNSDDETEYSEEDTDNCESDASSSTANESDAGASDAESRQGDKAVCDIPARKKRKVKTETCDDTPDMFIECQDSENNHVKNEASMEDALAQDSPQRKVHPIDMFLSCIGTTLKSLPPYYQALAKADIFAAAHKYELHALTDETAHAQEFQDEEPGIGIAISSAVGFPSLKILPPK